MRQALAVVPLLFAIGCVNGPAGPQQIEPGDVCAFCKMAISQKRFAAEVVDKEANVRKFDDIGCMLRFVRDRGRIHATQSLFVADYEDSKWLDASSELYVRSASIQTPMASGLFAVSGRDRANELARQFGAEVLSYEDLFR
jgi:copper chaperone NosL